MNAYRVKAGMVRVGGRCDPFGIGPYLSALEMRFVTKRCTNQRSLLVLWPLGVALHSVDCMDCVSLDGCPDTRPTSLYQM